jgi:hypothetical protein
MAATLVALAGALLTGRAEAAPLEVYGRLPSLEEVALSPDGSRIAMIQTTPKNDRLLVVHSLTEHKVLGRPIRLGGVKLRSLEWADDDHLLITSSQTAAPMDLIGPPHEWRLLNVWDVTKQKMASYPNLSQSADVRIMNVLYGDVMIRRLESHTVLFVPGIWLSGETLPALFRVDLDSGRQRLVREGSEQTQEWLVDDQGEVAAEEDYDEHDQRWRMLERRDGRLQEIASGHDPIDIPELLGFGPEPGTLLVQTEEDGDPVWRLLSLRDGTFGPSMEARRPRSRIGRPIA